MTPRELNARIKKGEIWYFTFASEVRQAGSNEWISLTAEGVMTWAVN